MTDNIITDKFVEQELKKAEKAMESYEKREYRFGSKKFDGVPKHVAIIADGNRRWGEENGKSVAEAHAVAAEHVIELLERASECGVEVLTVWIMDKKNFKKRSKEEIKNLLKLFIRYAVLFRREFLSENIRFRQIGNREILPKRLVKIIEDLEHDTSERTEATLNVAFNYEGRDELVRSIRRIVKDGVPEDEIDISLISKYLDTHDSGDPDLIIRTGKEKRLSGFMPWQSAPSELHFSDSYFPDFSQDIFEAILRDFPGRNRRFGG